MHGMVCLSNIFTRAATISKDGEIFLGTDNGMISFYPDSIRLNQYVAPIKITDFKIQNRTVLPGDKSVLQKSITYMDKLELKHNQDHLSFEFAILNYLDPELNQYKYILEGLDKDWIYSGSRNFAIYSNLKPGNYTFRVTGSNNDGIWNPSGTSLGITINPPPWLTWWAYVVYGFILIGIILLYRRYLLSRTKLRTAVEIERMEKEKVEELDHMRSRFFANISHEFRTPLTLLLGPIEELTKNLPALSATNKGLLQTMKRNSQRLQHLVSQLLDISKLETGKVKIQVSEGNLTEFIRTIILSFLSLAESKNIRYEFDLPEIPWQVYFDGDKLEKILTNLVSNAFKFTPSGNDIKITLKYISEDGNDAPLFAEISVQDTGRGIPAEKLARIFDRFFQVSDSDTREQEGTGIGLALTKEMVELYRGEAHVESEIGVGSTFTVKLPISKVLFKEDEIAKVASGEEHIPVKPIFEPAEPDKRGLTDSYTRVKDKNTPVLLIVEDNNDLRNYISRNLSDMYQILEAENGKQGRNMAIENIPDLVITDLMMPEMDGTELCQHLKNDPRTDHIPVIMLTAKADRSSMLEGLKTGADDYLIKPFDAEELQVRVRNLIEQRKKLRERFRKEFLTDQAGYKLPAPEDEFMIRVLDCMEQHMTKSEFNVEQMGKELSLSRMQLYRKILAMTDHTPSELIRNTRLKMAARMFVEGHKNVTRVMLSVGFDTSVHFAQYFRELFGINPSEYIKKQTPPKN